MKKSSSGLLLLLIGGGLAAGFLLLLVAGGVAWYVFVPRSVPVVEADPAQNPDAGEKARGDKEPVAAEFNLTEARKSVVFIKLVSPGFGTSVGTGFLVHKDGLIWTNRHVVELPNPNVKGSLLLVGVPSRKDPDTLDYFNAEVVYQSEANAALDFAVLKIAARPDYGDFPALPTSFEKVELASIVAALGFPHIKGEQPVFSFNRGGISATRVVFEGKTYYQTDAAVNPGNSGGPLVDIKGRAIGIVTFKKHNANNMGYAVYLSEIQETARRAEELVARVRPTAGPLDPKSLPTPTVVPAKAASWAVVQGQLQEKQGHLSIDNEGGVYWMTTREPLPEDFQVVIPCEIEFLKGRQVIRASQEPILRTLCIRFGTADTATDILEGTGYTLRWSHRFANLMREKQPLVDAGKGNPAERFVLTITKQGGDLLVTANGELLMQHRDPQPLRGKHKLQLGGYLSRLAVGEVSITKLGDGGGPGPVVVQKGSVETLVTATKVVNDRADIAVEAKLKDAPPQVRSVTVFYAREEAGRVVQPDGAGNWPQIPNAVFAALLRQADKATGSIQVRTADKGVVTYLIQAAYTTMDGTIVYAPPVRHAVDFGQGAAVKPPPVGGDSEAVVRQLPSAVAGVCVGGGGRFLILHLPQQRQLAVFDAHETKVVRYLPVAEDEIKFAAGKDKLVVVLPQAKVIQRWSLATFEREVTAPLPYQYPQLVGIAMGSNSDGPLLVESTDYPRIGEIFFFDIQTMKKLDFTAGKRVHYHILPGVNLRASADGRVFTAWMPQGSGRSAQSYVLNGQTWDAYETGAGGHYVPGPDGKTLYSAGQRFTAEGKPIGERVGGHNAGVWYLPAVHGPFYLSLAQKRKNDGTPSSDLVPGVHLPGDSRPVATLRASEELGGLVNWDTGRVPPFDQHVFLIPDAKLLVVLPGPRDKLLLHRFDLEELLKKSEVDYLFVQSQPVTVAVKGQPYAYQLAVRSKKGGIKVTVDDGPKGMSVSPEGKLTWAVPRDFAEAEVGVILTVSDASGQEVFHTFKLLVRDGAEAPPRDPGPSKPEPPVEVKTPSAPPPVGGIRPAPLKAAKEERALPSTVAEACIGGGGRFFILHLPKERKLAIFDVNEAKVVRYLSVADDNVKIAAGMDKLFIISPDRAIVQRFSLSTFEKEVTAPLPIKGTIRGVATGSAAAGPLLVQSNGDGVVFLDPVTFKELDFGIKERLGRPSERDSFHYRASPDGTVFGGWVTSHSQSMSSIVLMGKSAKVYGGEMAGIVLPGADNTLVTGGGLYTPECKSLGSDKAQPRYRLRVPSQTGRFYITCPGGGGAQINTGELDTSKPVAVYLMGDARPIATLNDVELPACNESWTSSDFTQDKRVLFVPEAKLIVILPLSNDRLILHRFDLDAALEKAGIDYLFVASRPPVAADKGTQFAYPLQVKSKKGGVKLKLESGPEGMKVTPEGILTWAVPKDFAEAEVGVLLTVSDASGQEVFHSFKLRIHDAAAAKPNDKPKDPPKP